MRMIEEDIRKAIDLVKWYIRWYMTEGTWNSELREEALKHMKFIIEIIKKAEDYGDD